MESTLANGDEPLAEAGLPPETFRVLHVDDEPEFSELVRIFLERADDRFEIVQATSASNGLDRLSEGAFDCVVSDHDMPGSNGIEFLEQVRDEFPELPFILFTGKGTEEIASDAISAGVSDYMQKETENDQYALLGKRIRNVVNRHRSRVQKQEAETRAETTLETSFDAMVVADDEGRYIEANQSACELFGLQKEELLGRSIEEFLPEDHDFVASSRQFDDSITDNVTLQIVRDDGEKRVVEYASPGNFVAGEHISVLRDVTDRDNREGVLREMHNIISNRDKPFEEQVTALLELGREELDVAYGTLSEIRGDEYIFEVVAADDESIQAGDVVPVCATNCEIAASTEQTLVLGDIERDAPEETDRAGYTDWGISCYLGAPVFIDNDVYGTFCFYDTEPRGGQFSEWEVTLVDLMSRWVGYELQRRQANVRLRKQNEKLEQYASIVSHDLRNPLGYTMSEDGTGFGLAIVKEIVEAHGWEIHVTDAETGGARFEVTGSEVMG